MQALKSLKNDPVGSIFLASTRSVALFEMVGLTAASHVFLMEPSICPNLEDRLVATVWRRGQELPVVVKRFYAKVMILLTLLECKGAWGTLGVIRSLSNIAEIL